MGWQGWCIFGVFTLVLVLYVRKELREARVTESAVVRRVRKSLGR